MAFGLTCIIIGLLLQMLNVIFVTMFYSTGLPLLFPIAMVSFFIAYWVDKALFTRFYRTPPAYDTSIARAFSTTLPWALLFHLAAGMWMMSNEDVFPPVRTSCMLLR